MYHSRMRWVLRQHSLNTKIPFVDSPTISTTLYSSVRVPLCSRYQQCEQQPRLKCHSRAYSSCFHHSRRILNDTGGLQPPTRGIRAKYGPHFRLSANVPPLHSDIGMQTSVLQRSAQEIFATLFPTTRFTGASHHIESTDNFQNNAPSSQKAASSVNLFTLIRQAGGRNEMSESAVAHRVFHGDPASNTTRASAWVGLNTTLGVLFGFGNAKMPRPEKECRTQMDNRSETRTSSVPSGESKGAYVDYKHYRDAYRLWAKVRCKLARDQVILTNIYQRINDDKPCNTVLDDDAARRDMLDSMWLLFSLIFCMLVWLFIDVREYIELTRQLNYVSYAELKKMNESGSNDSSTHGYNKRGRSGGNNGNDNCGSQGSSSDKETNSSRNNVKIE
ncbi:unnamed protein product [Phytomonas sp. EM1]|nr:unnamed protein product [Phytomonas sp. EM1]|eukprot:CCW64012.1 unnamed protein product [Phytomonas sp. isolate EM1]